MAIRNIYLPIIFTDLTSFPKKSKLKYYFGVKVVKISIDKKGKGIKRICYNLVVRRKDFMKESRIISRRNFLKGSTGVVGAGALAVGLGVGSLISPGTATAKAKELPYPFARPTRNKLMDIDMVSKITYEGYFGKNPDGSKLPGRG